MVNAMFQRLRHL